MTAQPAAAPRPQTPPAAPAAPTPAPAPTPAVAPAAPGMHRLLAPAEMIDIDPVEIAEQARAAVAAIDVDQIREQARAAVAAIDVDQIREQAREAASMNIDMDQLREQAREAREMSETMREQFRFDTQDQVKMARDMAMQMRGNMAFAPQTVVTPRPAAAPLAPGTYTIRRNGSADSMYERGQSALDNRRYDQALDYFTEVVSRGGNRVDGALYWKAYTLNKLGRRDDAVAAIAELRKSYPSSRWMDDAKALEIEVKQSSGQKVSPESESNDELKLLALEGIAQSDPDRALTTLDQFLKRAQSPNLKKRAVYVLALSNSPKAQQMLEQIARGGGNPDLQMVAIQYLGRSSKDANKSNVLFEIFNSSTDANVKRVALSGLMANHDKDHLVQIAKNDKNPELRTEAIRMLGSLSSQPELWTMYQAETDPEVKRVLLDYLSSSTDKLSEIARTDKDPKLRRSAILRLSSARSSASGDTLAQIYGNEQDRDVKRAIIDALYSQKNVTAMVAVGRKENDVEMKKMIVRRLVDMKSPEATQFLEEILK